MTANYCKDTLSSFYEDSDPKSSQILHTDPRRRSGISEEQVVR